MQPVPVLARTPGVPYQVDPYSNARVRRVGRVVRVRR